MGIISANVLISYFLFFSIDTKTYTVKLNNFHIPSDENMHMINVFDFLHGIFKILIFKSA